MAEADSGTGGLLGSARRVGSSLLALLHTRVELFAVELQEEKLRAIRLLVWLSVAVALGVAGILVAVGVLGLFLWQRAGYAGVIGLAVAALTGAAALLWMIHRRILRGPDPFAATVAEIGKDLECLRPRD
ncbi:MAG: phage holin family protein [Verrucomicrobia bacterium]|nr:phage holin family protein [Verrucomicrobiota bacterium]